MGMIEKSIELVNKYYINKVFVDAANPAIIKSLKMQLGEAATE